MTTVALYARVSSERQINEDTVSSQIQTIKDRIIADGLSISEDHCYIDNGYSGSNLVRPALEKLRDQIAFGVIDILYIHSPDRLSRKYAYQMILLEEFEQHTVKVVFLNYDASENNPEANLLLQMQGMIAEYERSKIMERHRRGRIYAAKKGSINVLTTAPYGYRYIDKYTGQGEASFEIVEDEAEVVRKLFSWIGNDRLSIGTAIRELKKANILTRKGKDCWDRSTICYMLKNPVYKGQAAFGKKKVGPRINYVRPRKDSCEQPKRNVSRYRVEESEWIYIPVPAIIDESLFDAVQDQLLENKKRARVQKQGQTYLLQGLLVCKRCNRAYCGGKSTRYNKKKTIYSYYRCTGTDSIRFGGIKMCNNKQANAEALEIVVWEEVKKLLKDPRRLYQEYQQRLNDSNKAPINGTYSSLKKQECKLEKSISLLIDSYTQEYILKDEFEPRIKLMRQKLLHVQQLLNQIIEKQNLEKDMELIISTLEDFSCNIRYSLDNLSWFDKRDILRKIVKRVEISEDTINVVYRVANLQDDNKNTQHCCNRTCETIASGSRVNYMLVQLR
ncbi:recombinase family protein [Cysteiniphilum marinum]|uniref:recombinase family protein n=1 Tax=Cysteiniphilum marinum TaxID=2774191 RepID=UPI00193B197F|nr:recombinase family protein [Cysteiniphilum marinum]